MIITIGDSHSSFGFRSIEGVSVYHLGARLMYNFKEEIFKIQRATENDCVVFCFGEIDCRCHIKKHSINGTTYNSVIESLTNRYIGTILSIKNAHNIDNIFIYNILPTRRIDSVEPYKIPEHIDYQVYDEEGAQPFPFIGSDDERKQYTLLMNQQLKHLCEANGLGFIDVYDKYIDEDGFLNMALSDGCIHIGDEKYLKEFIHKNMAKFI